MSGHPHQHRDLNYWSDRLERHFTGLRAERDRCAKGAPIFALEHGLGPEEITAMRELIDACVGRAEFSLDLSLPLAVVAAEVGYAYAGIEYWLSFQAKIPNWRDHEKRDYVRESFRRFSQRFDGAIPSGTWADHFSIICWPITHSILPTDLQRQLAHSLFESRREWSRDVLEDPAALGRALAARSWRYSGRYQALAENVDLLGPIASALLAEGEGSSPFLTRSVLGRLVNDLASERQAKAWLLGARSAAHKVRVRGVKVVAEGRRGVDTASDAGSHARVITPRISVRSSQDEWQPYVEIPDLSPLVEGNLELSDEMRRRRVIVACAEQPEPSGTLGTAGLEVKMRSWPRTGTALFELEGSNGAINAILADECCLSGGPPWLFRLGVDGVGTEVRGRAVVPGSRYLAVLEARPVLTCPSWITEALLSVNGASAWILDCPPSLQSEDLSAIAAFDLRALTEIRVEPAGMTAPSWDGSGRGEWLVGETPMIRIGLTTPAHRILCRMAGEEASFEPGHTETGAQILLSFPDLEVGDHTVSFLTVDREGNDPKEVGEIEITIRSPSIRIPAGGPREGMALIARPANPTLEEIWSGRGVLQVQGPTDVSARLSLALLDAAGGPIAGGHRTIRLPVSETDWLRIFDATFRNSREIERRYLDASGCRITVGDGQLGEIELESFRRFSPLALIPSDRGGDCLRVTNNTGDTVALWQYEFGYPDLRTRLDMPADSILKIESGGLILAEAGSEWAGTIFVPELNFEAFQNLAKTPRLKEQSRTSEAVRSLMELANRWEEADLPPNPIAHSQRDKALEAVGQEIWGLLGGSHWRTFERRFRREEEGFTVVDLLNAVGRKDREQAFARGLRAKLNSVERPSAEDRVRCLAEMLATHGDRVGVSRYRVGFADLVLRLATAPGRLVGDEASGLAGVLRDLLGLSGLFRAVRFALLTEVDQTVELESVQDIM
jgi:hypothetical protein